MKCWDMVRDAASLQYSHNYTYSDEELREVVERGREERGRAVEVEVGELGRSERVRRAAVLVYEFVVRVLFRVLLRAEEQHVLQEVRQAWKLTWVRH